MIIKHSNDEVIKNWGREVVIVNNKDYCGKILEFKAGSKFSMHFHKNKHETFFVLEGLGKMKCINTNDASIYEHDLKPGVILEIEPLSPHQVFAESNMKIIEFSTHHEDSDSYRVLKGDSQNLSTLNFKDNEIWQTSKYGDLV
jgi:mannose-6-phosphate isomerase-like protein (cupin superfamily)